MRIHNLNDNSLAIVHLGKAQIKTGYIRIIHPIDLIKIEETLNSINEITNKHDIYKPLYDLIKSRKQKLYESFIRIKPPTRTKRWDVIGTVWKQIGGNPDAEDLRIIERSLNAVNAETNKQIMINKVIEERLNNITGILNNIIKIEREHAYNHTLLINLLIVLFNIDTLQEQMDIIEDALTTAKYGIPNSKLFTTDDLKTIMNYLHSQGIHLSSFDDLMSQSTAQVMTNSTHIAYMLKVSQITKPHYEYVYVEPLIKSDKRVALQHNYFLLDDSDVYELKHQCKEKYDHFLCEDHQLTPANECLHRLLNGNTANCTFEKVYSNQGVIKSIKEGIIIINNAIVDLKSNCSDHNQNLNGSYLIIFEQCTVKINGQLYINDETSITKYSYFPTTGISVKEKDLIDTLPIQYLQNITLHQREQLEKVNLSSRSWIFGVVGSLSVPMVILLSLIGKTVYFRYRQRQSRVDIGVTHNMLIMEESEQNQMLRGRSNLRGEELIPAAPGRTPLN